MAAAKQGQNRTAGVTQVGPGKWKVRVYAGLDRNGRQRQATRVVRGTQAQAIKARRALQVEIEQSRTDSGAPGSFAELAERWYRMGWAGWSPSTAHGYRAHLDNHLIPVLGSIPADRLKPKDLDGLYLSLAEGRRTTRPMSAASVEAIHRTVRAILNFGVSRDEIKTNPAKRARPPRAAKFVVEIPSTQVVQRLLEAAEDADETFGAICRLAAATGMRRGELAALRVNKLDLTPGRASLVVDSSLSEVGGSVTVKAPKGRAKREVSLDDGTAAMLRTYLDQIAQICESILGRRPGSDRWVFSMAPDASCSLRPMWISTRWDRLTKAEGIGCRFHDLRHWHASQLLGHGVSLPTVSRRLGHASTAVTAQVYAHVLGGADREAGDVIGAILQQD